MFRVNSRKIQIYSTQDISYNSIIIIVIQRDNIFIKKKIINIFVAFLSIAKTKF